MTYLNKCAICCKSIKHKEDKKKCYDPCDKYDEKEEKHRCYDPCEKYDKKEKCKCYDPCSKPIKCHKEYDYEHHIDKCDEDDCDFCNTIVSAVKRTDISGNFLATDPRVEINNWLTIIDKGNNFDAVAGRYTVRSSGVYEIHVVLHYSTVDINNPIILINPSAPTTNISRLELYGTGPVGTAPVTTFATSPFVFTQIPPVAPQQVGTYALPLHAHTVIHGYFNLISGTKIGINYAGSNIMTAAPITTGPVSTFTVRQIC